jgi:Domain of unknown function (DUF4157)
MASYTDRNKGVQNSSAAKDSERRTRQHMKINDNRPEAIAQKKIIKGISDSPLMVSQRKSIQRIFNATSHNAEGEHDDAQKNTDNVHQLVSEEEELLQGKFDNKVFQLAEVKDEELLQGKFKNSSFATDAIVQKKKNDTGLPESLKSGVENLSGVSLDHVKVHYNSDKPAQLNALAYAQGSDIHVASGQEKHLPHETWHVVQQMEGRVKPTVQIEGVSVNDDVSLESEADIMGAKALS